MAFVVLVNVGTGAGACLRADKVEVVDVGGLERGLEVGTPAFLGDGLAVKMLGGLRRFTDTMDAPKGMTLIGLTAAEARLSSPKRARWLKLTMMSFSFEFTSLEVEATCRRSDLETLKVMRSG